MARKDYYRASLRSETEISQPHFTWMRAHPAGPAPLARRRESASRRERHWDFVGFIPLILVRSANFFQHLLDSEHPRSSYPGDQEIEQFIANAKAQNI